MDRLFARTVKIFPEETQYLFIDNSSNSFDAFNALSKFIKEAKGDMIVIIHDDIYMENLSSIILTDEIKRVCKNDGKAAVFGVAGISYNGLQGVGHFFDPSGRHFWGFPNGGRASSLDEFFLVIDRSKAVSLSDELHGFHFYGTDLCVNAAKKGLSSYVIDFPVLHKCNPGKITNEFFEARERFQHHLQKELRKGVIRTTCTLLYCGGNHWREMVVFAKSINILNKPNEFQSSAESQAARSFGQKKYGFLLLNIACLQAIIEKLFNKSFFNPFRGLRKELVWWRDNWRKRLYQLG